MTEISRIANAAARLSAAYGTPAQPASAEAWSLFLRVLLVGPNAGKGDQALNGILATDHFSSPDGLAQTSAGQLVELLKPVPRGSQKASVLRAVAEWWRTEFANECAPVWSRGLEYYRESLRKIRGLGPATVDELLMFAARLAVFPLDRGTLRVAVRHGWLDLPLEDDDAQSFFVRGLDDSHVDPREFSLLVSRVADDHCGREPDCEGCPLQAMLPEGGPISPESC